MSVGWGRNARVSHCIALPEYFSLESSAERVSHETREQSREDKGEDGERKRPPPLRARREEDYSIKFNHYFYPM